MRVQTKQTTYLGRPFVYPEGSLVGKAVEQGVLWDAILGKTLPALVLEEEPTLCDVGANVGASLLVMLASKPKARVVAFEPSSRFRPCLEENLRAAGVAGTVEVSPRMLGARAGVKVLRNNASTASVVSGDYDGHEPAGVQLARVTTLDRALKGRRVDFLKVDTDGYEFEVLKGAENTLARSQPALHFELAPYLVRKPLTMLRWLKQRGYHRFLAFSPQGEFAGFSGKPKELLRWAEENGYCDYMTVPVGSERALRRAANALGSS